MQPSATTTFEAEKDFSACSASSKKTVFRSDSRCFVTSFRNFEFKQKWQLNLIFFAVVYVGQMTNEHFFKVCLRYFVNKKNSFFVPVNSGISRPDYASQKWGWIHSLHSDRKQKRFGGPATNRSTVGERQSNNYFSSV